MIMEEKQLFGLLRAGLDLSSPVGEELFRSPVDWPAIYRLALTQGVLAIAWDGLQLQIAEGALPAAVQPDRAFRIRWAYNVEQIKKRYRMQYAAARELGEAYNAENIRTVVMKGFSSGSYYPKPEHRPCGDMDCFLMGEYERGNVVAEQVGAKVDRNYYKHSHILYKGLTVENHQFCTAVRGSRRAKLFERELQAVLCSETCEYIGDSHLEKPSPLFDALFLTIHARTHFLSEGISLRHLCDWAMLLKWHGDNIDWAKFRNIAAIRDGGLVYFAECMTWLAHEVLGVDCPNLPYVGCKADAVRILSDILYGRNAVFNTGVSAWLRRLHMVRNYWTGNWKFRTFCRTNALLHICRSTWAFMTERNPKL